VRRGGGDGSQIFGATALGGFGQFESDGSALCDPATRAPHVPDEKPG
jgi:hypothetical protein